MKPKYKRVMLKLSGEALAGEKQTGLDLPTIENICKSVKRCWEEGVQIGIVVGGGNFWRGRTSEHMDRVTADHIGMLATTMNALAVGDTLKSLGCAVRVQAAIAMNAICEPYIREKAVRNLEKGRIMVFGCGTGSPFFSTDSAAALRAVEIGAEIVLKATMVDGVYDKDPLKFDDAVKYETLDHKDILVNGLRVLDGTAAALCTENNIPIIVFNLTRPDNIYDAVMGEKIGTLVTNQAE